MEHSVSTLKTNTIQAATGTTVNVASGQTFKANTIAGTTTAGSVLVQGEGTNTTNLQQGLVKFWHRMNASSGSAVVGDSFNAGSITDNGVGNFTITITTNMANTNYAHFCEARTDGLYSLVLGNAYATNTGSVQVRNNDTPNLSSADTQDHTFISDMIGGDLA